jgi:hypothetical protein
MLSADQLRSMTLEVRFVCCRHSSCFIYNCHSKSLESAIISPRICYRCGFRSSLKGEHFPGQETSTGRSREGREGPFGGRHHEKRSYRSDVRRDWRARLRGAGGIAFGEVYLPNNFASPEVVEPIGQAPVRAGRIVAAPYEVRSARRSATASRIGNGLATDGATWKCATDLASIAALVQAGAATCLRCLRASRVNSPQSRRKTRDDEPLRSRLILSTNFADSG